MNPNTTTGTRLKHLSVYNNSKHGAHTVDTLTKDRTALHSTRVDRRAPALGSLHFWGNENYLSAIIPAILPVV
jgi:hypothetical protein